MTHHLSKLPSLTTAARRTSGPGPWHQAHLFNLSHMRQWVLLCPIHILSRASLSLMTWSHWYVTNVQGGLPNPKSHPLPIGIQWLADTNHKALSPHCDMQQPAPVEPLRGSYTAGRALLSPQRAHPRLLTGAYPGWTPQHSSSKHCSASGTVILLV